MLIGIDCHHIKDQRGIERYLLNLLSFFKKEKNINFILYVADNLSAKKLPKSDNFKIKILKSRISSTALFQHWLLPRQAKKDKLDLLFSPSYFLPFFYKGRTAVTIHDIIYETHPEWFNFNGLQDKVLIRWVGRKSAQKADIIFTPSEFSKKEIHRFYKIELSKIKTINLAADESFFNVKADKSQVFAKYKIKNSYFIFSASLFLRRCIPEIIIAFKQIAKEHHNFQLLIIGKNFSGKNITVLIEKINKSLGREAIVYISEYIDQETLVFLCRKAHAVIYLSLYEGFGLPVLEAMLAGVPVICGNAESIKEITKGNCFWIDNPKDIKKIAKAMRASIKDKEIYQKIKKDAFLQTKNFSWQKCVQDTLRALKLQILKSK